jgi:glycosyltransferase involved in cell wall biosynthesis
MARWSPSGRGSVAGSAMPGRAAKPAAPLPGVERVALVHDWLTGMRGGEKVLEVLCQLYPQATLYTLIHVPGSVSPAIEQLPVRTSFIQRLPLARRQYRRYLPLFPWAIERLRLDDADLVISSSHCAAKAVRPPAGVRHLCYCHSPMRYAWDQFDAYFGASRVGKVRSGIARRVLRRLARWDAATAGRVDRFLANSRHVAGRIHRYYNRESTVVYPPVDTDFFTPDESRPGSAFLVVSALVPYKRLEVAIDAAGRLAAPLTIVGDGPDRARLQGRAGHTVEFVGRRSNEEIRELYRRAAAVLLPGEEDFGIVPVEAQACGRPVVALGAGGALESVTDGLTGVLVAEPSAEAFADGMARARERRWDPQALRVAALRFSRDRFAGEIEQVVRETVAAPAGTAW